MLKFGAQNPTCTAGNSKVGAADAVQGERQAAMALVANGSTVQYVP